MQDENKKWFTLALGMTGLFGAYITTDIIYKLKEFQGKKLRQQKKKEQEEQEQATKQEQLKRRLRKNSCEREYEEIQSPRKNIRDVQGVTVPFESLNENQVLMDYIQTDTNLKSDFIMNQSQKRIQKIVFTGGPCAGKTSAIAYCAELLRDRGFKVLIVPEAATQFNQGGAMINMTKFTEEMIIKFQTALMKLQINLEDRFTEMALIDKSVSQTVILCDRGVMDGSAYMSALNWQALLDEMTLNTVILRDRRYDAVIHMVTAADGASEFYNLDNPSRYEKDLETAKEVDQHLRNAWHAHPYWILIENKGSNSFDQKLRKTGEAILHLTGLPSSLVFHKKYLLRNVNKKSSALQLVPGEVNQEVILVEDTFLNKVSINSTRDCRVRRRGQNDSYTYLYFETKMIGTGPDAKASEIRKRINAREYIDLMSQKDTTRQPVSKTRCVFFWNHENYILEEFHVRDLTFSLLIVQRDHENSSVKIELPTFLEDHVVREVTDEPQYSPSGLSKQDWYMPQEDFNCTLPELNLKQLTKQNSRQVINDVILEADDKKMEEE